MVQMKSSEMVEHIFRLFRLFKKKLTSAIKGISSSYPNICKNDFDSFPGGSAISSALFFLSSLFIFSAKSRAFDFNVFFAFLPFLKIKTIIWLLYIAH